MEDPTNFTDDPLERDQPASELNLAEYWAVIVQRWRLIALSLGVALTVAVIYSVLSKPLFRATTMIDVEPDRSNPLDIGFTPPAYYNVGPEYLATQTRLMQTREILL